MATKAKKTWKFWVKLVVAVILSALLLVNLLTVILSHLGLRRDYNWLPGAFITIESGSMEPQLYKGDLAIVWRTPFEELEVGDIVAVVSEGEYITHGIVRIENDKIITKGLQNKIEDEPTGEESYCAKMILRIKGGAKFFNLFTEPTMMVLLIVLIFILFFGRPILTAIFVREKDEEKGKKKVKIGSVRVIGSLLAASCVFVAPVMTSARYFAEINGVGMADAKAIYFNSNCLSENGNNYRIQGWNGKTYDVDLEIKNFDNSLLFNRENTNVHYRLIKEIITDSTYAGGYNLSIVSDADYSDPGAEGDSSRYVISGSTAPVTQSFKIKVASKDESGLKSGQMIKFRVTAETLNSYDDVKNDNGDGDYHKLLTAEFVLQVAQSGSFIGTRNLQDDGDSNMISYNIKTNPVAGIASRTVKIVWSENDMYIYRQSPTFIAYTQKNPNCLITDKDTKISTLTLELQGKSSVDFQFFKTESSLSKRFEDVHTEYVNMDIIEIKVAN